MKRNGRAREGNLAWNRLEVAKPPPPADPGAGLPPESDSRSDSALWPRCHQLSRPPGDAAPFEAEVHSSLLPLMPTHLKRQGTPNNAPSRCETQCLPPNIPQSRPCKRGVRTLQPRGNRISRAVSALSFDKVHPQFFIK